MLHSQWLIRMLEKQPPRKRLTALFEILEDWAGAPHIDLESGGDPQPLLDYLAREARSQGFHAPESVALQLYLIALGALQQSLREQPDAALHSAGQAAIVLLESQRPRTARQAFRLAASFGTALLGLALLLGNNPIATDPPPLARAGIAASPKQPAASPLQIAALYQRIERLRSGVCNYPQALMLPTEQRSLFLEGVVEGELSAAATDPHQLNDLVNKVECYYPPVLMTAS